MNPVKLEEIELESGAHKTREEGMCALEAVAWLAGEPHSDAPQCACPVITKYVIGLNDGLNHDERQLLKPYLPRIIGTRDGNAQKRVEILAMGAVTKVTPRAIEFIGLKEYADKMRKAGNLIDATVYAANAASSAANAANAANVRQNIVNEALALLDEVIEVGVEERKKIGGEE